ncbi:response regulator [Leptolyngbya sp. FACHB-17]|uniref:hybrid sensor histidine kinase/response regulator n=1 Tax=unclassified Leptolyngbya TaxID=2650499 RepID=UPI001681931B|nr:response regulator [Leptolyngbya sp. FACHB-17]MBD2081387.1 response regulator [Leptolyngbya sp. FACHB-17]
MIHFLLIDDNPSDRTFIVRELEREFPGSKVTHVTHAASFEQALTDRSFNFVITDYRLRWSDGLTILRKVRDCNPNCPVIMFTDSGTQEIAVAAIKAGLDDYLLKSSKQFVRLPIAIRAAFDRRQIEAERDQLLERERAARVEAEAQKKRATFLAEASQMLVSSLDYRQVLTSIAHMAVPTFADWCLVDIVKNTGVDFTKPIVATSTPDIEALLLQLRQHYPPAPDALCGPARVLQTGTPELTSDLPETTLLKIAQDEKHLGLLRQLQAKSYMTVPMNLGNRTLGTIAFASVGGDRRYSQADLEMALELGHRAAIALDHARLYQEAQEANRIKDEFLAIVSHELRTPVNALLGWAQMLRGRKLDEVTAAKALETIERNARLQSKLIDDILDISRIVQNRIRLNQIVVHLVPVINEVLEDMRSLATAKEIEIESIFDPSIGLIIGDPERLQQVVGNLLSNAIKFTPQGGHVVVQLSQIGNQAQITICDNGQGIPAEFLPYVFDRFRQGVHTTTRKHGGLGLGLAIVRHLVEMQGGRVFANSAGEGLGATFTVQLPIQELQLSAQPEPEKSAIPSELPMIANLRVLMVDDDQDTLDLMSFVLEECQAEVKTTSSVDAALAVFSQFNPHVLVSDIGMPEKDGYDLIRKIRQLETDQNNLIPAIALTAFAKAEDQQQALSAGFQRHMAKPVNPYDLVAVITSLIS